MLAYSIWVLFPHHINQLRDLESKAYSDGVIGMLDRPHPLLVTLEKVPQQGILHLSQRHKVFLSWKESEKKVVMRRKQRGRNLEKKIVENIAMDMIISSAEIGR